jgi:hypothetical protein
MDSESARIPLTGAAARFVEMHADDVEATPGGKIRFALTGMEFPAAAADTTLVSQYLAGPALRRAKIQRENLSFDFDALRPNIVPHKAKNPASFLWCRLTEKTLPRNVTVVRNHISGRKYVAALARQKVAEDERVRISARRAERADAKAARSREFNDRLTANVETGKDKSDVESNVGDDNGDNGAGDDDEFVMDSGGEGTNGLDADAMEENEDAIDKIVVAEEDPDAFWTRGRGPSAAVAKKRRSCDVTLPSPSAADDSDSASDEWGSEPVSSAMAVAHSVQPGVKAGSKQSSAGSTRRGSKSATTALVLAAPRAIVADPVSPVIVGGAKRSRDNVKIPKRRRPRAKQPRGSGTVV